MAYSPFLVGGSSPVITERAPMAPGPNLKSETRTLARLLERPFPNRLTTSIVN